MSRQTPLPEIVVSPNILTDDETGQDLATIIVEAKVANCSNGFLLLDDPGDLYILRNTIDDYISRNNIKNPFL